MEKTVRIDDIDGTTEDVQTIRFSLANNHWEIDLGPANRDRLTHELTHFTQHARRVRNTPRKTTPSDAAWRKTIREWAAATGRPIASSGRIPDAIIAAYNAAQHPENTHQ